MPDDKISVLSDMEMSAQNISGPISFENVTFSYPTRRDIKVLKNFSMNIDSGRKIAIVGESGCGKSTISQLLLKYYPTYDGTIKLNGYDIRNVDDRQLRSMISIVNQEPDLFPGSIFDNIAYGHSDEGNADIKRRVMVAAQSAQINDHIMKLTAGYQTLVGDRGAQLSGGQKQRIAIARALFRNPKILILDEATSALDGLSKRLIEEAINNVSSDTIVISITHDTNSIITYDSTYHMTNGRIISNR